jgi:predicted  nucleic acid-binding Zn-ribbon protein
MNLKKITIKELKEFDVKSLPKSIKTKKVDLKESKLSDHILQESEVMPLDFRYNNGWDRKANAFTSDAKKRYIVADKEYHKNTGQNMTIHSGKRDVYKQAQLYIQYKYHNQGNPASWPGCSFHNWGLAADMVRTNETALISAMKKGGWTKTVADEGWHFECTTSADHSKAANKIKSFRTTRTGLAYKWSEQVAIFYQKVKDYQKRVPIFNRRLEKHKINSQQLQAEIDNFNSDLQRLKNRINQFNTDVRKYNSELARAKNLYNEIMNMPAGSARDRKIREYNRLVDWLDNESDRIDRESRAIDSENARIERWSNSLDRKIADFKREDSWLNNEYNALTKLESDIEQHKKNASELLDKINTETGK